MIFNIVIHATSHLNAQLQEEKARLELENKRLREIVEKKSVGV